MFLNARIHLRKFTCHCHGTRKTIFENKKMPTSLNPVNIPQKFCGKLLSRATMCRNSKTSCFACMLIFQDLDLDVPKMAVPPHHPKSLRFNFLK